MRISGLITAKRSFSACLSLLLSAAALAGCGGASPAIHLSLQGYVLHGGEETGFRVVGHPSTDTSANDFDAHDPADPRAARRLSAEGFREAMFVHTGSLGGQGISQVIVLGSSAAAAAELKARIHAAMAGLRQNLPPTARIVRFSVPRLPGATDVDSVSPEAGAANILFREGRCVLLVADETSSNAYRTAAVAGARAIYARSNSRPGVCAT